MDMGILLPKKLRFLSLIFRDGREDDPETGI